ncbi:MAG: PhnD/SsuA/transferrin family substrate-binding protein [Rhodospirillaceae bacterium]|nr:PhnD/SsuA/transferrin family substrate-binding protein [Rhodospirillaceae bacterium]MBT5663810.1 PhnD/SsuA/transferrin family substrate-binding protein [Rhodospirillaceae bacterium]
MALAICLVSGVRAEKHLKDKTVAIGVLAFRGADKALRDWTPTADYLQTALPGYRFRIDPLPLAALREAIVARRIDFLLTNSGSYVDLEARHGVSRIATLKRWAKTTTRTMFGAAIFVRTDRTDIRDIGDLEGKSLVAVARGAFGGFQMAWKALADHELDPFADLSDLQFLGFPQDKMVYAVRDGVADAGTVRSGVLETMAREGKIKRDDFRVLNPRTVSGFPYAHSTALYPEWPFAKLRDTPSDLAEKVAIALLGMPADSAAARAADYAGWTVPLDYQSIHDLFRELRVGPYTRERITLYEIVETYWEWIAFAAIILALVGLHGVRTEHLVARRTRELSTANVELEQQIAERQRAEERARRHEAELAHVSRVSVIGEMASGLAHELNQPLSAINSYASGCIRRLLDANSGNQTDELLGAMREVVDQSSRAGRIIARIRGYIHKQEPRRDAVDLNSAVRESAALLAEDARRHDVSLTLALADELPMVAVDLIEIEQVILNLSRNAIDAMSEDSKMEGAALCISTYRGDDGAVTVSVRDNGPGLSAEDSARVWEPFHTTKSSGLGLGLSICQTIVEAHGGRIWADFTGPGGANVSFSLPERDIDGDGDGKGAPVS